MEVYCTCRKPDSGELMVGCDGCDDWFHFACVRVDPKFSTLISSYYCPYCELEGKGITKWKRQCRVTDCYKPIKGQSKYCSPEHGLKFMAELLGREGMDKDTVGQLIASTGSLTALRELGKELPNLALPQDNAQIRHVDAQLAGIEASKTNQLLRKKLLTRAKENVKLLNDELSASKKKKIGLCGYESLLTLDTPSSEEQLSSNDISKLKELYEEESTDSAVCLLDKRKCQKHNGWAAMLSDDIDGNIIWLAEQVEVLRHKRDRLVKINTVDKFDLDLQ